MAKIARHVRFRKPRPKHQAKSTSYIIRDFIREPNKGTPPGTL
jgi:hypothetical protein